MWHWVARGNIQQISYLSPDRIAFALRAHAAPSGECNYYVCVCAHLCTSVCGEEGRIESENEMILHVRIV